MDTKLAELVALEEIRRLTWLYAHHRDRLELDGLMAVFTGDATCDFGPDLGGSVIGAAAIRAHFQRSMQHFGDGKPFCTMHAVTNPWIDFRDTETAFGRTYLIDFVIDGSERNPLTFLGLYDDEFRKVDNVWKIHRRRLELAWPPRQARGTAPGEGQAGQ